MAELNWEGFEKRMGTWAPKIKPIFDTGVFSPIYEYLKKQGGLGKKIAPISKYTFRAFIETPIENVKCVLMGMCPYHTIVQDVMVADGLCMGCENTRICQPSLQKFYEGLEIELFKGLCLECYWNPSVAYLSHQGVLMTNAALTTEIGQPGAHQSLWGPFTEAFLRDVIKPMDIPVIFLGKDAYSYSWCLGDDYRNIFDLYHPVYASYKSTKSEPFIWDTKGVFTEINRLIEEKGKEPINWLEKRMNEL